MEFYSVSLPNAIPLKLVTARANYGIGLITGFVGGFCSLFGVRNSLYAKKLKKAELHAFKELETIAKAAGADGVMDIRCQIDGLSFLVCGTAYIKSSNNTSADTIKKELQQKAKAKEEAQELGSFFNSTDFMDIPCPRCGYSLSVLSGVSEIVCPHCANKLSFSAAQQSSQGTTPKPAQLDLKDIEYVVSTYLNKPVSISDIACTLVYVIPASTGKPQEMHLSMSVGNDEFSSLDLMFFDLQEKGYYYKNKRLALDEAWLPASEIFNFDVSLFKSFDTEEDTTD